jgi:methylenetetrahydrofolate--tRNA-(uracil-5-)-methyltransferase
VDALRKAETVPLHKVEAALYFEGCLPLEVMADRGTETLAFGPLKPVGLVDPASGRTPHAVLQLRAEDRAETLYNLVGCQTRMRIGDQKRVFRSLPGFERAVFARYGSVHRNTFIRSPALLTPCLEHRTREGLFFAGQIAGVEGYVESTAIGLLAGVHVARRVAGLPPLLPPETTAIGALSRWLVAANPRGFQPMNVNFGIFPPLACAGRVPRRERNERLAERALADLESYRSAIAPGLA